MSQEHGAAPERQRLMPMAWFSLLRADKLGMDRSAGSGRKRNDVTEPAQEVLQPPHLLPMMSSRLFVDGRSAA